MSSGKVVIALCLFAAVWHFKGKIKDEPPASAASKPGAALSSSAKLQIRGSYVMQGDISGPRMSLSFIDDLMVQMLADGKPWGANNGMCTYSLQGKKLNLSHACGVWHFDVEGNTLSAPALGFKFQRAQF